jgi:hypothetical protein
MVNENLGEFEVDEFIPDSAVQLTPRGRPATKSIGISRAKAQRAPRLGEISKKPFFACLASWRDEILCQ